MSVSSFLRRAISLTEQALDHYLPSTDTPPTRLHDAMRYAVFAGGKRIRPALALAACEACGGTEEQVRPAMAALEMLHTYTLIHDDLPAMDDDDLRRGKPTCHKAFDEATAILAGDALLTRVFAVLSECGSQAVLSLADAAGSCGVVGGQQDDLDSEGHPVDDSPECIARLERIHRGKTAALIRVSCELGAIAAGAPAQTIKTLADFGESAGLAFQVIDDILDVTASADTLGKTPGKDAATDKLTYVAVYGLEAARIQADTLATAAETALATFGPEADNLRALGQLIVKRDR